MPTLPTVNGANGGNFAGGGGAGDGGLGGLSNNGYGGDGGNDDQAGAGGDGLGGAIYQQSGLLQIRNSTFTSNFARAGNNGTGAAPTDTRRALGGAIRIDAANPGSVLQNNTFIGNGLDMTGAGTKDGGAVSIAGGTVTVNNNLVANSVTSPNDLGVSGGAVTGNNNLVRTPGGLGGLAGTVGGDPLVSALGDFGGTTQTFALLPGSPAINAGFTSGTPAQDQRHIVRGAAKDIGAFESQGFTLAIAGGNNQIGLYQLDSSPSRWRSTSPPHSASQSTAAPSTFTPVARRQRRQRDDRSAQSRHRSRRARLHVTADANAIAGTHTVTASATGGNSVTFNLENKAVATLQFSAPRPLPRRRDRPSISASASATVMATRSPACPSRCPSPRRRPRRDPPLHRHHRRQRRSVASIPGVRLERTGRYIVRATAGGLTIETSCIPDLRNSSPHRAPRAGGRVGQPLQRHRPGGRRRRVHRPRVRREPSCSTCIIPLGGSDIPDRTAAISDGVVTFNNLSLNNAANGYRLSASGIRPDSAPSDPLP